MKLLPAKFAEAFSDGDPVKPQTSMTRVLAFGTVALVVWVPAVAHVEVCLIKGLPIITLDFTAFVTAGIAGTLTLFGFNKRAE